MTMWRIIAWTVVVVAIVVGLFQWVDEIERGECMRWQMAGQVGGFEDWQRAQCAHHFIPLE